MNIFDLQIEIKMQSYHLIRAEYYLIKGNVFMYQWHLKKAK